ncbi:MAG: large-conductance mechanosensitive channel protein MscL [Chloracidobacterium sp.]|uniref:large-conductance mechanosensitive channel protein MscL n=1 Tax=Chloracidobacterium validum TaxID=2821543 RepID=UPI002484AE46|nr:large-conductance mechanosensitive channel protein MscL [Chloracidobacterium validum]
MGILQEFKDFVARGSVIDLAVGVIIGGAFGKIVASFVEDIIMPPVGLLTSGVNFTEAKLVLKEAAKAGDPVIAVKYGNFIQVVIQFVIVAAVVFLMVKTINRLRRPEPTAPPPEPTNEEKLLTEIRDLLKR